MNMLLMFTTGRRQFGFGTLIIKPPAYESPQGHRYFTVLRETGERLLNAP